MKFSSYTAVYALTLLLSAALLFSIQPMFSKMILPLLGGAPQVWNTAMVFFQITLLAGYAYAHGTTRLMGVRAQAVLHIALLLVFAGVLPFAIAEGSVPPAENDPTLWQLTLMASVIGGPFFVLAGSAPMFQRWFAETDHPDADNPYFLYSASNLGSMTALLAYPILIEPLLSLPQQSTFWMMGYTVLIGMSVLSAALVWGHVRKKPAAHDPMFDMDGVSWRQRGWWLFTAFLPSSLMLGVTTFITTDIASAPLLWILPLAIYVGTFILVFARRPLLSKAQITMGFSIALALTLTITMAWNTLNPAFLVALHLIVFFFAAMLCHTALAEARPGPAHLTEFYLTMSIGGALGGILNAIIAPQLFILPLEYTVVLLIIIFLRYQGVQGGDLKTRYQALRSTIRDKGFETVFEPYVLGFIGLTLIILSLSTLPGKATTLTGVFLFLCSFPLVLKTRWSFNFICLLALLMFPPGFYWNVGKDQEILKLDRNFFGFMRVVNFGDKERAFIHGTTNHGTQALLDDYRLEPLSYYSRRSPLRDIYAVLGQKPGAQDIAVLGLGVGVTSCFRKENRHYTFFEIDPDVAAIAQNPEYFTYLSECGSPYDIILGDARLKMQDQDNQSFDMIFADAYSSDNIPIHLLTVEALRLYLDKLKDDGVLVFNISNRYLDIEPVLHEAAQAMDMYSIGKASKDGPIGKTGLFVYAAQYVVLTRNESFVNRLKTEKAWSDTGPRGGVRLWTDNYSNIFRVLGNRTWDRRMPDAPKK